MQKIYVVEDDTNIRNLINYALKQNGFEAAGFEEAGALYAALKEEIPDLLILDIMLPGEDGYTILNKVKSNLATKSVPIIMLTAKTSEYDKVKGLDMGADDYITKPFSVMEMISRVRAVLRRYQPDEEESCLSYQGIDMDTEKREVRVNGRPVKLTYKEFELLYFLMSNVEVVLSRNRIVNAIWGTDYSGETRTVDVHIRSLRRKLGDKGDLIKTVRNVGYKLK